MLLQGMRIGLPSPHRKPPEVGLVEKLSGSLYWWVELGVPSLHIAKESTETRKVKS